ncbi:MAG TPA: hypothetical protein VNK41_05215 [Vicinamibacterales bacterium]|nr:hypothetical protein [Vicinamibacterales bacterium]
MAQHRSSRTQPRIDSASTRTSSTQFPASLIEFYREEFLKHRECLEYQRDCYSEQAIRELEMALTRIMAQLDELCAKKNADEVIGRLLRKIDLYTGLSGWSDPKNVH